MVEATQARAFVGLAVTALVMSCRPDLEGRPSLIEEPTVLALRSSPAEALPGETVDYEALFVSTDEAAAEPESLSWQSCLLRKPLTTAGAIHPSCLNEEGTGIALLGTGLSSVSAVDADACKLFGPTPPDSVGGEEALRAADPDTTGGYYQPVVLREASGHGTSYSIGVTRLSCGIGAAAQEQVVNYNQHYRRNENPRIDGIIVNEGNGPTAVFGEDGNATAITVAAGAKVHVEVAWPSCPSKGDCGDGICSVDETADDCVNDCSTPTGCLGSETYLMFDPASRVLVEQREQMRVSWYATAGSFDHDRTGANLPKRANASENGWLAPLTPGTVRFWLVLRDDRRGVGWQAFDLTVEK